MGKRESWRSTLNAEMQRWSAMSYDELIFRLRDVKSYEVDTGQNKLQVEVEIIENTPEYVHVMIGVDDSTVPHSMLPLTDSFIRHRSSR
jgi:hypothetical protein